MEEDGDGGDGFAVEGKLGWGGGPPGRGIEIVLLGGLVAA